MCQAYEGSVHAAAATAPRGSSGRIQPPRYTRLGTAAATIHNTHPHSTQHAQHTHADSNPALGQLQPQAAPPPPPHTHTRPARTRVGRDRAREVVRLGGQQQVPVALLGAQR
jgi:hypothetical protein